MDGELEFFIRRARLAKVQTKQLGGVGLTQVICDNPSCKKPCPIVFRAREGGEFCSERCRLAVEELRNRKGDDHMVSEDTAAATAPAKTKKKLKGAAKVAGKAKKAPKASKEAGTSRAKFEKTAVITRTKAENPYRGKRAEIVNLMKSGLTVEKFGEKFVAAGFSGPGTHLARAVEAKLITVK